MLNRNAVAVSFVAVLVVLAGLCAMTPAAGPASQPAPGTDPNRPVLKINGTLVSITRTSEGFHAIVAPTKMVVFNDKSATVPAPIKACTRVDVDGSMNAEQILTDPKVVAGARVYFYAQYYDLAAINGVPTIRIRQGTLYVR